MHNSPVVAVIDYGMGNLFSVKHACERAGLHAEITSNEETVQSADAVILPGVGAFGSAMALLEETRMTSAIREAVQAQKPFVGICLGIQLLMTRSLEFGAHSGLGIIPGAAVPFAPNLEATIPVKVPHMQWNRVRRKTTRSWDDTLMRGIPDGAFFYFVHSYYVVPEEEQISIATSSYAGVEFVCALQYRNVFACQFHPERSGPTGLRIYQNLARQLRAGALPTTKD